MHHLVGHDRSLMILLLVACLFRGCFPDDGATSPAVATDTKTAEASATDTKTAAGADTETAGTDKPSDTIGSELGKCATELMRFGSEMATAAGEALKAFGRVTLATFGLLVNMLNGVSRATAKTGDTMVTGYQTLNRLASKVPVIGTVTTGGENLLVGTTAAFSDNSAFNSERRVKMMADLRTKIDGYHPGGAATAADVTPPPPPPPSPATAT